VLKEAFGSALSDAFGKGDIPVPPQLAKFYQKRGTKHEAAEVTFVEDLVRVLSEKLSQKFLSLKIDEIEKSEKYKTGVNRKEEKTYEIVMSPDLTAPPIELKPRIDLVVKFDKSEIARFTCKFTLSIEARFDHIKMEITGGKPMRVTLGRVEGNVTLAGEIDSLPFKLPEASFKADLSYSVDWRKLSGA
jgi:hypothetical protein